MAVGPYSWSTTALTNGAADANINWAEGSGFKMPDINNSARAMMAALRGWIDGLGGGASFGGAANAYTITNSSVATWSAYAAGQIVALKIPAAAGNTGASTVNVDALGVKSIVTSDGGALVSGDLVAGGVYLLAYDGTNFQVLNTIAGGSYQPLDADLTAIAALGYTSGAYTLKKTAADTWALIALTAAGEALLDDADASAQRTTLGLGTAAVKNTGTSGNNVPLLDGANTAGAVWSFGAGVINNDDLRVTNSGGSATMRFDGAAGQYRSINVYSGGSLRWAYRLADNTAESGANAGSNFLVMAFSDAGASIGNPLTINRAALQLQGTAGTAALPTWTFAADPNTGAYNSAADQYAIATGGVVRAIIANAGVTFYYPQFNASGSAAAPAIAFDGDTNLGLYRIGADNLGISLGGTKYVDLSTSLAQLVMPLQAPTAVSSETGGTLTAASANKVVNLATAPTMPASVFAAGAWVGLYNDTAAAVTITQGAGGTQRKGGTTTTGNLSLAAYGYAPIKFKSATEWTVFGNVS